MVRIVIVDFLLAFPAASRSAMYVFYVASVIVRPDMISVVLLLYFATQPLSVPFWIWLSRHVGKHKAVAYGLFFHALVALCYIIPGEGDILLYVMIHLTSGFVAGGHNFLLRAMVADATDADNLATGQQRSGLYYSLVTTTNKVGLAIGVAVIYPLLQLIGFDPAQGAVNGQEVMDRFLYIYIAVPFLAEIPAAWILYRYPLDEAAQTELRRRIEARESADAAATLTGSRGSEGS
jgi:Na+/melibiose symporter-like transporter